MFELTCYCKCNYGDNEELAIEEGNYSRMDVSEEEWDRVCESIYFATINFIAGHKVNIRENGSIIYQTDTQNMPKLYELQKHRKKNTWQNWSIGFSNLTEEQQKIIETKLEFMKHDLEKFHNITVEALESDSGEF